MPLDKEPSPEDKQSLPTSHQTSMGQEDRSKQAKSKRQGKDMQLHRTQTWHGYALRKRKMRLKTFAKYCPLVSAIFAPLSTLLDIPALTQHWYAQGGTPLKDPKACLILSAIGLALNIFANILLVMRFSAKSNWWWRHSTRWSLICWLGKTVVAAINLIVFGILSRNGEGYTYLEGFWCAVISIIDAGIISITLLFHYFFAFGNEQKDQSDIRSEGRRFMLSVTAFISILAIQSLVFSKIENWSYSDGIYFSTQVALTIGYGDFAPSTTAGKVLVFPFSVLTISQLGNEITQIIGFISSRAEDRREKWRKRYEGAMHREANKLRPRANLTEEMALIHQINQREELTSQMYDLAWSAFSLLVFWLIGATMFSQIEGWPYGDAIYVVMILSLTIGFGDFTPVQPAGKVVFIVYALMAVPIVTSFAVQTITGLLSTYSERGAAREAFLAEQRRTPEAFAPHADFILRYHESYNDMRDMLLKVEEEGGDEQVVQGNLQVDENRNGNDGSQNRKKDGSPKTRASEKGENDQGGDDDDPSDYTITGKRKSRNNHLSSAEKELRDDYDRAKHIIEQREEETHNWERAKIEHEEGESTLSESEDGDKRTREDTGKTLATNKHANHDLSKPRPANHGPTRSKSSPDGSEDSERKLEIDLLQQLMKKIIQLEAEARQMMLDSMDKSVARTLLLADRNVQARDVRALEGDDTDMLAIWQGETAEDKKSKKQASNDIESRSASNPSNNETAPSQSKGELDMLSRVRRYRNTFAEILVVGSILQKLEGEEKEKFERWREEENDESNERGINSESDKGGENGKSKKREGEAGEHGEDIEKVADKKWDGLNMRLYKRWAKRIREKDLKKWETV